MKELTIALTYTVSTLFLSALRGAETQITVELGMNLGILGNIYIYEWLSKETNTQLTSVTRGFFKTHAAYCIYALQGQELITL